MRLLTLALTLSLISIVAFTQDSFDNEFYFRFGYSLPLSGQYGGTKSYWEEQGIQRFGFMGEVGQIFILRSIQLPEGMALGINADYFSVYWHQLQADETVSSLNIVTISLNSKVGPSFTYSPKKNIAFDAYVKAFLNLSTELQFMNEADEWEKFGNSRGIGLSTGINVRLNVLMLGIEFNSISHKFEYEDSPGEYLGNFADLNDTGDKSTLPSMTFSLGFSF